MDRDQLDEKMFALLESDGFPSFDAGSMGDALLYELEKTWDVLPESTRAVMLGVATCLKKHYADELVSDLSAQAVINSLRK